MKHPKKKQPRLKDLYERERPDRHNCASWSWQSPNLTDVHRVLVPYLSRPLVLHLKVFLSLYFSDQPGDTGFPRSEGEHHSCRHAHARGTRWAGI